MDSLSHIFLYSSLYLNILLGVLDVSSWMMIDGTKDGHTGQSESRDRKNFSVGQLVSTLRTNSG